MLTLFKPLNHSRRESGSRSVSVIIPNYNGARFLGEAIDSALEQEGVDLEVIVVDDGSTDNSHAILEAYRGRRDPRLRILYQENQGACVARNHGLSVAVGHYVLFLDSDDLVLAGSIAQLLDEAGKSGRDASVYGNALHFDESGRTSFRDEHPLPANMDTLAGLIGQNVMNGRVLHPAESVRQVGGFDVSLPRGQEYDLHLRMALNGSSFRYHPVDVLRCRIHFAKGRISAGGFTGKDPFYFLGLAEKHGAMLDAHYGGTWPEAVKMQMARRLWEIGRGLIREGSIDASREYFARARTIAPRTCVSGRWAYRILVSVLGPIRAERLLGQLRRLRL